MAEMQNRQSNPMMDNTWPGPGSSNIPETNPPGTNNMTPRLTKSISIDNINFENETAHPITTLISTLRTAFSFTHGSG